MKLEEIKMVEKGTEVFLKKSKQNGVIRDVWNHQTELPTEYLVVADNEIHHICLKEDFEIITK